MVKSITAISRLVRRSPGHTQIEPEGPLSVTNSANPHNAVTAATRPSDLQTRAVGASESADSLGTITGCSNRYHSAATVMVRTSPKNMYVIGAAGSKRYVVTSSGARYTASMSITSRVRRGTGRCKGPRAWQRRKQSMKEPASGWRGVASSRRNFVSRRSTTPCCRATRLQESRPIVAASLCRGCQLGKGGSSAGILTQRAPTARGAPVTGPATHPSPTSRHWIRLSHRSERTPSTSSFFRHTPILAAEPRAV